MHEVLTMLLDEREVPVYIVHFAQAAALERAQALASLTLTSRAQRDEIAEAIGAFRFLPKFTAEVLRQVGFLVAGSALVIIFICFIVGAACGIAAESIGQAIGASVTGPTS